MGQVFISYSRVDLAFAELLYRRLQQMRPNFTIWYDQAPHGLLGGDLWWDEILNAVAAADIFIYVLSNESVQSRYCQAEFEEARRLQKRVICIQARDRTKLTGALRDIHYVDMKHGVDDPDALARLSGALERQMSLVRKRRPLWQPRTPKPSDDVVPKRAADAPHIDTPTLEIPRPERRVVHPTLWRRTPTLVVAAAFILIFGAVGVTLLLADVLSGGGEPTAPATSSTQAGESGVAAVPSETSMPEPGLTLDIAELVQTLDAGATLQQATRDAQATAAERATEYAVATQQKADETATATLWTAIPTPNMTASVEAYLTERAAITQTWIDSWTDTPTFTPTATPDLLQEVLARAETFDGGNDNWEPVVHEFNGTEMVLVPAGCFMMGSEEGNSDEQPVHEVCVDAFWLGKTEVTNSQYRACVDAGDCSPPADPGYFDSPDYADHPIVSVSWTQAVAYAAWVGGALPTEAQWEYAARGPESWEYPWGEAFDCRLANIAGSECDGYDGTAPVGSFPGGASWTGALDMSGNVWEWASTAYREYPYHADDGREDAADANARRVLRGGSWSFIRRYARAAVRSRYNPDFRYDDVGFRVVRVPHL